jgi:hypothetical protein
MARISSPSGLRVHVTLGHATLRDNYTVTNESVTDEASGGPRLAGSSSAR